jgi:hypothetical protein
MRGDLGLVEIAVLWFVTGMLMEAWSEGNNWNLYKENGLVVGASRRLELPTTIS